jgi:hypothetical protein
MRPSRRSVTSALTSHGPTRSYSLRAPWTAARYRRAHSLLRCAKSAPQGPGPLAHPVADPISDEERIARDAKIKQATKDHEVITRFRGMFEPSSFTALFGDDVYPTLSGAKEAVCEIFSRTVPELAITDSQVEKFLKSKFGSARGTTDPDRISVTLFAQRQTSSEHNITDFIIMLNRFRDCTFAVYGASAKLGLEILGATVTSALYPVTGNNPNSAILGLATAIDVVNDAMRQVGHSTNLRAFSGTERWLPPMVNAKFGPMWQTGLNLQSTAMMEAIATAAAAAATSAPANKRQASTSSSGSRAPQAKKQRGSAKASSSASSSSTATPRCGQQDRPGGCSYGLRCKFRHDADKPKADTGGATAHT